MSVTASKINSSPVATSSKSDKGKQKKVLNNKMPPSYTPNGSLPPQVEAIKDQREMNMAQELRHPGQTCYTSPSANSDTGKPRDDFNGLQIKRWERQQKELLPSKAPKMWDQKNKYTIDRMEFIKVYAGFFDREKTVDISGVEKFAANGDMLAFMEYCYEKFDKKDGEWVDEKITAYLTPERLQSRIKITKDYVKNWGETSKSKKSDHYVYMKKKMDKIYAFMNKCEAIRMPKSKESKVSDKEKVDGLFEELDFLNEF